MTFLVWNMIRICRTGRHNPTKNSQECLTRKILISKSIQENVCCKYYSSKALEDFSFYTKYFITDLQKRMKT